MPDKIDEHPLNKIYLKTKRVENSHCGDLEIHGRTIPHPDFVHEVEGYEDLYVIIKNIGLLKNAKMISVPAFRWQGIAKKISPLDTDLHNAALSLLFNHHIIMYEPPELFHNLIPQALVKHALRGKNSRKFYQLAMIENNQQAALELLPPFEREFVKVEWDALIYRRYKMMQVTKAKSLTKIKKLPGKISTKIRIDDAWLNTKSSYPQHIAEGALITRRYPSASYVPAVKTLNASSDKTDRDFVIKQNKLTDFLWRERLQGARYPTGRIWFHISLNKTIFTGESETGIKEVLEVVNRSFSPGSHAGICLTMQGWEEAFLSERSRHNLELLTREIGDIASHYNLPFYAARSKWVGIYLIDDGLMFPGAMINGSEVLSSGSGGISSSDPNAFGKVAIYGYCRDLKINDLFDEGKKPGEFNKPKRFHHLDGVPDYCPLELQYDANKFRREFGKLRNIVTHSVEVKEIREALESGQRRPAKEYIKKSDLSKGIR